MYFGLDLKLQDFLWSLFYCFQFGHFWNTIFSQALTLESEVLAPAPAGLIEACLLYVSFLSQDDSALSRGLYNGTWKYMASFVSCTKVSKVRNAKASSPLDITDGVV